MNPYHVSFLGSKSGHLLYLMPYNTWWDNQTFLIYDAGYLVVAQEETSSYRCQLQLEYLKIQHRNMYYEV